MASTATLAPCLLDGEENPIISTLSDYQRDQHTANAPQYSRDQTAGEQAAIDVPRLPARKG